MNRNIYPTHTCFDDALDMLEEAVIAHPDCVFTDEFKVVHAICLMKGSDERYAHAWLEYLGKQVWFRGYLDGKLETFAADIKEYYEDARVQEFTKYTPREVNELNKKFVTYGPWEEKYLRLCRDKKGANVNQEHRV